MPRALAYAWMAATSSSVSVAKRLIATTVGTPNCPMLSICRAKFAQPFSTAVTFSASRSFFPTPPFSLRARAVATTTAASGLRPALRHLMSKNFSAPRSAPNPASVTT